MTSSPAQVEQHITFHSRGQPSFLLEGVCHLPQQVEHAPVVVLCHPQPVTSNMNDVLTVSLTHRLASTGIVALRFNFRGVGKSQGQQTDGRMEPLDLAGALDAILTQPDINPSKVCVVGHGFGANIALMYAPFDPRIRTVVAISLLLYRAAGGFPKAFERPKLFVTGELDEVCPPDKLETFVEELKGPKGMKVITGARHLMRGHEEAAVSTVIKYIQNWANMPGV